MKHIFIRIFNFCIKKGWIVKAIPTFLIKSGELEHLYYRAEYYRVVNPHLINLSYFRYLNNQFIFQSCLYKENNALIQYPSGAAIVANRIVRETVVNTIGYMMRAGLGKDFCLNAFFLLKSKRLEKGFLLTGLMSYNFFHFLIDSLPRILDYLELRKTEKGLKVILNNPTKFTFEYLQLLGVNIEDCVVLEENLRVSEVFISNNKYALSNAGIEFPNLVYSKSATARISSLLYELAKRARSEFKGYDRIYISRKDVGRRILMNEDEIFDILRIKGFARVIASDLPVAEQILLFSNAKVIVSVHGAGLANLIYSKNALVIELFPRNKALSTLYQMHQLGQIGNNRHILFVCDRVTTCQDVFVDPNLFAAVLDAELEKS